VGQANVRFGSKADMCSAKRHVRFTPNSDRESDAPTTTRSVLRSGRHHYQRQQQLRLKELYLSYINGTAAPMMHH
jgi:hypothetical protein